MKLGKDRERLGSLNNRRVANTSKAPNTNPKRRPAVGADGVALPGGVDLALAFAFGLLLQVLLQRRPRWPAQSRQLSLLL